MDEKIMNKKGFELLGVEFSDYLKWCEMKGYGYQNPDVRRQFFKEFQEGKIRIKDGEVTIL